MIHSLFLEEKVYVLYLSITFLRPKKTTSVVVLSLKIEKIYWGRTIILEVVPCELAVSLRQYEMYLLQSIHLVVCRRLPERLNGSFKVHTDLMIFSENALFILSYDSFVSNQIK